MEKKHGYALIMKGGGIKGISYIGALEVLEQYYSFSWFAGTSAGAISATLLGCGYSVVDLKEILYKKNFNDFKDANFIGMIWNLMSKRGLYEAHTFTQWMDNLLSQKLEYVDEVLLEDLPFRTTVYSSGRGHKAIEFDSVNPSTQKTRAAYAARCSMSIPYFFTPEFQGGHIRVDGGVQNNYPVEQILESSPGQKFVGLYLGPETFEGHSKSRTLLGELIKIWTEANDYEALRKYKLDTIVIDTRPIKTTDFSLSSNEKEFLLQCGRVAAYKFLNRQGLMELDESHIESKSILEKKRGQINHERQIKKRNNKKRFTILTIAISLVILLTTNKNRITSLLCQSTIFEQYCATFEDLKESSSKINTYNSYLSDSSIFIAYIYPYLNDSLLNLSISNIVIRPETRQDIDLDGFFYRSPTIIDFEFKSLLFEVLFKNQSREKIFLKAIRPEIIQFISGGDIADPNRLYPIMNSDTFNIALIDSVQSLYPPYIIPENSYAKFAFNFTELEMGSAHVVFKLHFYFDNNIVVSSMPYIFQNGSPEGIDSAPYNSDNLLR